MAFSTAFNGSEQSAPIDIQGGAKKSHKRQTSGICHDLRDRATGLQGNLELALDKIRALASESKAEEVERAYRELDEFNSQLVTPLVAALTLQLNEHKLTFKATNPEEKEHATLTAANTEIELSQTILTLLNKFPARIYRARRHLKTLSLLESFANDERSTQLKEIKEFLGGVSLCYQQITKLLNVTTSKEEVFSLDQAIENALLMVLGKTKQKKLHIRFDKAKVECLVKMDYLSFSRVLDNLLSNAIKYNSHAGEIEITLTTTPGKDNTLEIAIAVTDTGAGINPVELAKLFTAYHRGDSPLVHTTSGLGLGLHSSRKLARHLNGDIQAKSQEGKGSTFTFTCRGEVPSLTEITTFKEEKRKAASTPPISPITPPQSGRRCIKGMKVLIVDDQKINQKILEKRLSALGAKCESVNSGEEAIKRFEQSDFDTIFMDINMPGMGGLAAAQAIRAMKKSPNVLIFGSSANISLSDEQAALNAGMDGYITKPYILEKIIAAIETPAVQLTDATSPSKLAGPGSAAASSSALSPLELPLPAPSAPQTKNSQVASTGFFSNRRPLHPLIKSTSYDVRRNSHESQRPSHGLFSMKSNGGVAPSFDASPRIPRCTSTPILPVVAR